MARTITINLSDADERALAHNILDPEQWLREALAGKINTCRKRFHAEGEALLKADPSVAAIPTNPVVLETLIKDRVPTRVQRDAAEAAIRDATKPIVRA